MNGPYEIIPGVQKDVFFPLYALDGTDILTTSPTFASGDAKFKVDGGTSTNFTPQHRGDGIYLVSITAGSTTAGNKSGLLVVRDLTSPQTWLSTALEVRILSLAEVASRYYDGPVGPGVYFQQTTGAAGTTLGTNGTATNPCSSIGDAKSIADTLGVNLIYMLPDASATFTASANDYHFYGTGNRSSAEVILGGQDIKNAKFEGIKVSGTSGATGDATFINCELDSVTGLRGLAKECGLTGTSSVIASTAMTFEKCYSLVPGASTPGLTFAASASVGFRHYSGGIQFNSGAATNAVTVEGVGKLVIAATCTSLAVQVRGAWLVSDLGTTSSLTYDSHMQTALDILEDTGTTIPGELASIETKIDTVDTVVDRIEIDTTSIETKVDTVDTVVDAILVDTGTDIPATLTTIEGKVDTVDTVVDAILIDTGTSLPATLTTIDGKVDTVDTVVDAILVDTGTDIPAQITALNDFDPATDAVANVTTVGSVTGLNASLLDAAITTRSTFDPATDTVTNVTNVASVTSQVQSNLRSVDGVALATHTAGKVPADATATVSGTVDANLIEVDGVTLATHTAGKVPADATATIGIAAYLGAIWFDDSAATTGTTIGTHGLPDAPVNDFDDAVALCKSTGLNRIYAIASTCSPTSTLTDLEIVGIGSSTYNFGGVVHTNVRLVGMLVFGICGAASNVSIDGGTLSTTTTFKSVDGVRSALLNGTVALQGGSWSYFDNCSHAASSPLIFDMTANTSSLAMSKFSGEVTLSNLDATNTVVIDGQCSVILDSSCTGGRVYVRGQIDVTDNSNNTVTVTAVTGVNLTEIMGQTAPVETWVRILNATIDATVTSGGGSTDSWSSTGIPTTNDAQLIDKVGVFVDGNAKLRGFVVTGYTDSTKTLTVDRLNVAPSNGDRFLIFA